MHLLSDYTLGARTRYESHRLSYTPDNADPIELGGILGAAILAALYQVDNGSISGVNRGNIGSILDHCRYYQRTMCPGLRNILTI